MRKKHLPASQARRQIVVAADTPGGQTKVLLRSWAVGASVIINCMCSHALTSYKQTIKIMSIHTYTYIYVYTHIDACMDIAIIACTSSRPRSFGKHVGFYVLGCVRSSSCHKRSRLQK